MRLVALVRQRPELTLVPPAALKLNLDAAGDRDSRKAADFGPQSRRFAVPHRGGSRCGQPRPRWWVGSELKDAEVKPGFSKASDPEPRQGGSARAGRRSSSGWAAY